MRRESRIKAIITIIIVVISLGFTGYILFQGSLESTYYINEETAQLEITGGFYSKTIDLDMNTQINIVSPKEIIRRTNGSAVGDNLKGTFTIEGDLSVYLNLSDKTMDWIEIVNGNNYFYFNLKTNESTQNLYDNIVDFLNS